MKSQINREEVPTTRRKPFVKTQLVQFIRGQNIAVVMLLSDEGADGEAEVVCLHSNATESWWKVGEADSAKVSIWDIFTDTLTISN